MTRRCILAYLNAVEPFSAAAPSAEMLRGRAAVERIAESVAPALSILDCANALAFIRAVEPNDLARFHSPSVEPSPRTGYLIVLENIEQALRATAATAGKEA